MKNKTKEKIIENTIKYIQAHGYVNLSLRHISRSVNLTTGAFYKHFKNKTDLFYQTSIVLSKLITQNLTFNKTDSAHDQLLQIAQQFCELFTKQPHVMRFLFFNPSLKAVYGQTDSDFEFLKLTRHLAAQINPGKLTDQQFFNQIWSFIQGYALLIQNKVTTYDPQMVALTLEQLVRK